jgi:hypothetical protein
MANLCVAWIQHLGWSFASGCMNVDGRGGGGVDLNGKLLRGFSLSGGALPQIFHVCQGALQLVNLLLHLDQKQTSELTFFNAYAHVMTLQALHICPCRHRKQQLDFDQGVSSHTQKTGTLDLRQLNICVAQQA